MSRLDDESLLGLDELASVLRSNEGPPEPITNGARKRATKTPGRRGGRRVAVLGATVAIALLVGSAFGFGLGSSVTPSGTARSSAVGFGFLPARGWNVVQSGALGPSGASDAIAANVPLDDVRESGSVPVSTLASLRAREILVAATFTLRGDPAADFAFPVSELPLRLGSASLVPVSEATSEYRLRAGVGGYNVDARIYFGAAAPSRATLAEAQDQLSRLVVAGERVTIAARPAIAPQDKSVTLFGSIDSGKAGESVEIQAKDCGQNFFRAVAGTTTVDGGGWSLEYGPQITTTLRAVWRDSASPQVTVKKRTQIHLTPKAGKTGRYTVWIVAQWSFWHKRVLIQRRDPKLGVWKTFRSLLLTDQAGRGPAGAGFSADVTLLVPRGTQLRASVPASTARPCYLSATSLPVRA